MSESSQRYQVVPAFIHIPVKPEDSAGYGKAFDDLHCLASQYGIRIVLDEHTPDKESREPVYTRREFDALPDYQPEEDGE